MDPSNEVFCGRSILVRVIPFMIGATSTTRRQWRFGPSRSICATVSAIEGPGITHWLGIHNGRETQEEDPDEIRPLVGERPARVCKDGESP